MTSQTAHIKSKQPPYDLEPNPPMKIFCVRHCNQPVAPVINQTSSRPWVWMTMQ